MSEQNTSQKRELHVIVFCGPNGSGKSTLIEEVKREGLSTVKGVFPVPERFINPDQIARDLKGSYPTQDARDRAAFSESIRQRSEAISGQSPFAYETVMSHPSRISEMLRLKEQGYRVLMTFITTDSPEKNVARVTFRYQSGTSTGHYVPPERVRERYERTLALLPKAAEVADAVFVYDNSKDFAPASLQAVLERGQNMKLDPAAKSWVTDRLVEPLREREHQFNGVLDMIRAKGLTGAEPDELRGAYKGTVLAVTPYYVAVLDEPARQAVIHDRLMLDTAPERNKGGRPGYVVNENITVKYSMDQAPVIERHGMDRQPQSGQGRARPPQNKDHDRDR